jgi:hypothetical protein
MILIVTNRQDQTADFLILELKKRKLDYMRFNTEDFPRHVRITWKLNKSAVDGCFVFPERIIRFDDVTSVWYRRPVDPVVNNLVDEEVVDFIKTESLWTLNGIWGTLDCFWVSKPNNIRRAENKLFQLQQAIQAGFEIPNTVITNDPETATLFYEEQDKDIVYKPIRKGRIKDGENQSFIFTNPIDRAAARQLARVRYAPSLLQKYVRKQIELRVTVIGENVFAVSLDSQKIPAAIHDWRRALNVGIPHKPFTLPVAIESKCKALVRNLELEFGAIDLIVTSDDQFVFLEINPNGQWAWIQQLCPEIHLRESLADILIHGKF